MIAYVPKDFLIPIVDQELSHHNIILEELRLNLKSTQDRMKFYADCKQCHLEFAIGDWVWLKLKQF